MAEGSELRTGTTLLVLLRDFTDEAWRGFVDRYGPPLYRWCRGWRLQEADAQNVTQEVLLKLYQKLRSFTYNRAAGTFRAWLKTVAHHAWQDYLDAQRRLGAKGAACSGVVEALNAAPAGVDLAEALAAEFDLELLDEAKARVRLQVSDRDWLIFQELALHGRSGAEVAAEHGIAVATVFMIRSRVQQKLKDTVRALEEGGPRARGGV
jgi:RNA polymerase sigma-70 factor (ECF subfamily)